MAHFTYGIQLPQLPTEPLPGGSLFFTTKFPEISGTHLLHFGRMKG